MLNKSSYQNELDSIERQARGNAKKTLSELLRLPENLEKVEFHRETVAQKKSSVEAMLKSAVESNLDGVKTGLTQLSKAQNDIMAIRDNLKEIAKIFGDVKEASRKLEKVKEENSRHSLLATAVDNVKYIFNVPECVKSCQKAIDESRLLQAHKLLCDLETSRNDLLLELHNHQTESSTEQFKRVRNYFEQVQNLRGSLEKQLFMILSRVLDGVKKEPKMIVNVLRIIEREQMADNLFISQYDTYGFLPPGRPLKWRNRCFETLQKTVSERISANQAADRSQESRWITINLEHIRQATLNDLRTVNMHCQHTFPPVYKIQTRFLQMYHEAISKHLEELIDKDLTTREEIFEILSWESEYYSEGLMKHSTLSFDLTGLKPLISEKLKLDLKDKYIRLTKTELTNYLNNTLRLEKGEWIDNSKEPSSDSEGHFKTELPYLISSYCERTMNEAKSISDDLATEVMNIWAEEMEHFHRSYLAALKDFKDNHTGNRQKYSFYVQQIIANANSCESIEQCLIGHRRRFTPSKTYSLEDSKLDKAMVNYKALSKTLCKDYLMEELAEDIKQYKSVLFTAKWIGSNEVMQTINATIEDYNNDFRHLNDDLHLYLMSEIKRDIQTFYYRSMFSPKIAFKSPEQRKQVCDQIQIEISSTLILFNKICPRCVNENDPFSETIVKYILEPIIMTDTELLSMALELIKTHVLGLKLEKLTGFLAMREDLNKSAAEAKIKEIIEDSAGKTDDKYLNTDNFFSKI
ncbi:DgyrCDS13773 [Dimorphilus gyrociliatus]|uniref:DgyrCDS13773 n=1 Tax=Dimorphilus gyrociliatus TaxID=2664684 RepID=A0A7I8WBP4_9ANNE|nr:DgyrCDS13773 [Dimorphilus gyrociliatus]